MWFLKIGLFFSCSCNLYFYGYIVIEISESFKKSLCSYENGCVPSNIYNIYNLLDKYYGLFGVFGVRNNKDLIFTGSGLCLFRGWRKLNKEDYLIMQIQIYKMFGSNASIYTIKQAVSLLALGNPYHFNCAMAPTNKPVP